MECAAERLKNGRAAGPDAIPNELLKYAPVLFSVRYAQILNDCFMKSEFLSCIGGAAMTPLQKAKKPKGPIKSLRPLTLSGGARGILSLVTLHRISVRVGSYTQPWQCGYKHGRAVLI